MPDTETRAATTVVRYLEEARATELALVSTLKAHIAVTPHGSYRQGLERHLNETRDHAQRVEDRLHELGEGRGLLEQTVGVVQSVVGQVLVAAKGPIDLIRGDSGEETLLKNAKDECATEALEIATYIALEELATAVGDEPTAALARDIRADEERMLDRLREEIPRLTRGVVSAQVRGNGSFDVSTTGAADTLRDAGRSVQGSAGEAADKAEKRTRATARQARKVPGVARAEGEVKGAVAGADDLAISDYDGLNANEIVSRLGDLSQIDLAKVEAYERKNASRTTVLSKIDSLQGDEPWPGYDELTAQEVLDALEAADDDRIASVRDYERRHKDRTTVLGALA